MAKANRVSLFHEHALVIVNILFPQHKRWLYTWKSPDGQYWNQIDYNFCSWRWRNSIQSAKTRPGADCDPDYELLIAKFRFQLKKVGETTRPFRYDLNQIPYNYTMKSESECCSVMSNSLQPSGLYSPWNFPGQNIGVGSRSPLQENYTV